MTQLLQIIVMLLASINSFTQTTQDSYLSQEITTTEQAIICEVATEEEIITTEQIVEVNNAETSSTNISKFKPLPEHPNIKMKVEYLEWEWAGPKLTARKGVNEGPSGKETYYNLNMSKCVRIMRDKGFSEEEYPYWVREDGVKMLGPYVMVAADLKTRPKGTILYTSLGVGIVVDTGSFIYSNPTQIDIAVSW